MTLLATGGVFIGGGIAAKNLERLTDGSFMKAFMDKGFFRRFMETMPVHVAMEQKTCPHRRRAAGFCRAEAAYLNCAFY
jgi:glucokinase